MTNSAVDTPVADHDSGEAPDLVDATDPDQPDAAGNDGGPARVAWTTRLRGLDVRWKAAIAVLLVAAVTAATWWAVDRNDDLPPGTAFRIGDTDVSVAAVDDRIDALKALYGVKVPTSGSGEAAFRQDAAKSMAVQLMLQDEAEQRDIVVSDEEIDDTLRQLIAQRYPDGGRTAFVAALGQLGATEDQVRDEIGDQLLVSRLFDDVVADVSVTDADVREAFMDRREELGTPVRRSLRNIVVADQATARRVLGALRAGTPFPQVAAQYSLDASTKDKGGELGVLSADELEKAYATAAFQAPVGGLFGPVKTKYGWNVGLVERELPARPARLNKVRSALRRTVLAEQSVQLWRNWLADVIKAHDVTYADAYRPDDPYGVPDVDQADLAGTSK